MWPCKNAVKEIPHCHHEQRILGWSPKYDVAEEENGGKIQHVTGRFTWTWNSLHGELIHGIVSTTHTSSVDLQDLEPKWERQLRFSFSVSKGNCQLIHSWEKLYITVNILFYIPSVRALKRHFWCLHLEKSEGRDRSGGIGKGQPVIGFPTDRCMKRARATCKATPLQASYEVRFTLSLTVILTIGSSVVFICSPVQPAKHGVAYTSPSWPHTGSYWLPEQVQFSLHVFIVL